VFRYTKQVFAVAQTKHFVFNYKERYIIRTFYEVKRISFM